MEVIGNIQFDSTYFLLLFVLIYLCYKFNFTLMLVIKIVVVDSLLIIFIISYFRVHSLL